MILSVCLIVKDEESVIARSLSCVQKFADEIIVVDTGSADNTVKIAEQFTSNVYFFKWCDDFSAARNYAFSKAKGNYLMWLDADDVIEEGEIQKILALKKRLFEGDTFMLKYKSGPLVYYRERILRNTAKALWSGRVHEAIAPFGKVCYEDITITHCKKNHSTSKRNLDIYNKMQSENQPFSARDEFYFARELYYHGYYREGITLFEKVLSRSDAWAENKISACEHLADCYLALNDRESAKKSLLRALLLSSPRAELLCKLANIYFEENDYPTAIFYYKTCLLCVPQTKEGGFCFPDCYNFIPYIQLCVCYSRLGDNRTAEEYNALAGKIKPDDASYLHNVQFFQNLK